MGFSRKFEDEVDKMIEEEKGFSDTEWSPIKDLIKEIKNKLEL